MTLGDIELITPSGRFASIRAPTVEDAYLCGWFSENSNMHEISLKLVLRCAKLDGEEITDETLAKMNMYDLTPILEAVLNSFRIKPKTEGKNEKGRN